MALACLRPVTGASEPDWKSPVALERLATELERLRVEGGVVGLSAALIDETGVCWAAGFGLADRERGVAASADTPFRLGSISKTFTAVLALRLAEAGRLDLDAPLRRLAPGAVFDNPWEETDPVRFVHLLEHTSGLDDFPYFDAAVDTPNASAADYARRPSPPRRVHWPPGRWFRYSSIGTGLAGHALEVAGGADFDALMAREVFGPLGLVGMSFRSDAASAVTLARSYRGDGVTPAAYWHLPMRPAGALHGTARELGRFVAMLIAEGRTDDGGVFLAPASVRRLGTMTASEAARHGAVHGNGFGMFHFLHHGHLFHGHWGSVDGFRLAYGFLPGASRGFVLLLNTNASGARHRLLDTITGALTGDLAPTRPEPDPDGLADFASAGGWYLDRTPDRQMLLWLLHLARPRRLVVEPGGVRVGDVRYVAIGPGLLALENAPVATAVLVREDDGGYALLEGGARFQRVGAWRVQSGRALAAGAALGLVLALGHALVLALRALFVVGARRGWLVRSGPLLAGSMLVALLVMTVRFGFFAGGPTLARAGTPGPWTWTIWLLSVTYPLTALASVVGGWRAKSPGRLERGLVLVSAGLLLAFAIHLATHGWFALRFWA